MGGGELIAFYTALNSHVSVGGLSIGQGLIFVLRCKNLIFCLVSVKIQ